MANSLATPRRLRTKYCNSSPDSCWVEWITSLLIPTRDALSLAEVVLLVLVVVVVVVVVFVVVAVEDDDEVVVADAEVDGCFFVSLTIEYRLSSSSTSGQF